MCQYFIIIPILHIRKLRLREVKQLSLSQTASKGQSKMHTQICLSHSLIS